MNKQTPSRHLEVGNTEVLARMISELIDCDLHRIDAADPYPDGYDATVGATSVSKTPTRARGSRIPWPRSASTTSCC